MSEERNFWFADVDRDQGSGYIWQPVLQMGGMCSSMATWFATRVECEDFIREEILTAAPEVEH
jgi:hypothetical protein